MDNNTELTMKNCSNYVNITSVASVAAGVFVGKVYDGEVYTGIKISFENCNNYGTLIFSNGYSGMLFSNGCTFKNLSLDNLTVKNCANYGSILSSKRSNLICGQGWSTIVTNDDIDAKLESLGSNLVNADGATCKKANIETIKVEDNNFVLKSSIGATKYSLSFGFWVSGYKNGKEECETWGSASTKVELTEEQLNNLTLPYMKWTTDTTNAQKVEFGNGYYYTNGTEYVFKDIANYEGVDYYKIINISLTMFAYDQNNNVISVSVYKY